MSSYKIAFRPSQNALNADNKVCFFVAKIIRSYLDVAGLVSTYIRMSCAVNILRPLMGAFDPDRKRVLRRMQDRLLNVDT